MRSLLIFCVLNSVTAFAIGPRSATLRELLTPASHRAFIPVPVAKQSRNYTCGTAALLSILSYHGEQFTEGQLQYLLGSSAETGTSQRAIQTFVTKTLNDRDAKLKALCSYTPEEDAVVSAEDRKNCPQEFLKGLVGPAVDFSPYTLQTFPGSSPTSTRAPLSRADGETSVPSDGLTVKQLEALLRARKPVLILMQAWPGITQEANWRDLNNHGHYAVVVGFDRNNFYLMDPVVGSSWSHIPRAEFVRRWHDKDDTSYKHFGMVISRRTGFRFLDGPLPLTQ